MGRAFTPLVPILHSPLLCCPACGAETLLRHAEDLPPGLARMIAICPACAGHGENGTVLVFADGCVVDDTVLTTRGKPFMSSRLATSYGSLEHDPRG